MSKKQNTKLDLNSETTDQFLEVDEDIMDPIDEIDSETTEEEFNDENDENDENEENEETIDDNNDYGDDNNDKCLYKYAEEDDSDYEEEVFDDESEEDENLVKPEDRITKPILYKYERVRLIGDRAKQLALGAKPMIKNVKRMSAKQIAELELKNNTIPFEIQRSLPNGKKERWNIKELRH